MLRVLSIIAALAVAATAAYSQNLEAIKQRQEAMKAVGAAAKGPGAMIKGEAGFELGKVQTALKVYQEQARKLPSLYPDDSKTGGDTAALPAVWEKKQEFIAGYEKLAKDAAAAATTIKDEASFKREWPKVMESCGACHKAFRRPKS
jgi:cytochrome c556